MPVIDAHHHFWDPARADYPWLTDELAAIRRAFGVEDLRPMLEREGIDGSILVQTRSSIDESVEFLEMAAATPFIVGVVGWVDLRAPDVARDIARLQAAPGGEKLVGIRHQVHDEADPDWLAREDVRAGISAVGAAGLAYDLLVRERELPAAIALVRSMPDVRFVIDHLAKPRIREAILEPWASRIGEVAAFPNVTAKLSGLVTEADWASWRTEDLRPYVDHAIEVFGPDRLMFGSDWPVCLLAAPYGTVLETARALTASLDEEGRAAVFGGTAIRTYRLEDGIPGSDAA